MHQRTAPWHRWIPIATASITLAAAGSASAAVVVEEDRFRDRPLGPELVSFPCLGQPGMDDDAAIQSGTESGFLKLTAAGVDDSGEPVGPFILRLQRRQRLTIDPVAPGLPTYAGTVHFVVHARTLDDGEHTKVVAQFSGVSVDGADRFTFRFHFHVLVQDGEVRFERQRFRDCTNAR